MNVNYVDCTPEEAKAILADDRLILATREEIESLTAERDQLKARLEAAERERDELREELAYIKQQLEWVEENGDTYQKSALMDLIRRTLHGLSHTAAIKEAIAARDAKQRRDGAAQVWDIIAERSKLVGDTAGETYATEAAKRLREGGE